MKEIKPYITVKNASSLITFYKKVFQAEVVGEIVMLDDIKGFEHHKGKIGHAELQIGGSTLYVCDETDKEMVNNNKIHFILEMDSSEELLNAYALLQIDGDVYLSPQKQSWCELTCYVQDKFGIAWSLFYNDMG